MMMGKSKDRNGHLLDNELDFNYNGSNEIFEVNGGTYLIRKVKLQYQY